MGLINMSEEVFVLVRVLAKVRMSLPVHKFLQPLAKPNAARSFATLRGRG